AAAGGKASMILTELLAESRERAVDESTPLAERLDAIRSLQLGSFKEHATLLENLLQLKQPQPVQAAAMEVVGEYSDVAAARLVLEVWPGLSPGLRARAAETLLSRPAWVGLFLDTIEEGKVARSDIDPSRVQLLLKHPEAEVVRRVRKIFDGTGLAGRADVVKAYQRALEIPGNEERGKMVFKKNCSACHRLEEVGNEVGAELRGIRQRGLASVMLNVLDPNREVKPKYLTYVLETTSGKVLTGMIATESANSITIRRVDGTSESVQRVQIDRLRSTGLSFMPEGLEKQISVEAMADLLSYLDSID
ncbi:MAG: c-type cytochrome, partial [Pirellulaceae bacterium]|nr:c-type cytochrome [Pirellulaceae bacterium]